MRIRSWCDGGRAGAWGLLLVALIGPACATRRPGAVPRPEQDERPDHAWFVQQRMSSGQPIPLRARERALEKWRTRAAAAAAVGNWTFAGPTNIGGRLTSLAVDPINPDHIWAGAAAGRVFESTDPGANWSPGFAGQPPLPVGA